MQNEQIYEYAGKIVSDLSMLIHLLDDYKEELEVRIEAIDEKADRRRNRSLSPSEEFEREALEEEYMEADAMLESAHNAIECLDF